jgi:lysozyme
MRRLSVATLTVSATFLIALAVSEGYAPTVVTTKHDPVPTGGFGSTKNETGQPLKTGEAMPPVRALVVLRAHVARDEQCFHRSLPDVELTQGVARYTGTNAAVNGNFTPPESFLR